jgi:hypothetical protein
MRRLDQYLTVTTTRSNNCVLNSILEQESEYRTRHLDLSTCPQLADTRSR